MATTTATDVLSATDNYGKANTAFALALQQASNQREAAMIGLGADFSSQAGKVYTPNEVGGMLGGAGLDAGTTIKTGFGEGALATIDKTAVGNVYQQQEALDERGVSGASGISQQAKALVGDQQGLASQEAVQGFQGKVAEANLLQSTAKADLAGASAALDTASGDETPIPKPEGAVKPKVKPKVTPKRQKQLASARAAANQKAKKAGKPMPYGKGGAPAPKPKPGVKPGTPAPAGKKAPVPTGKPEGKKGAVIPKAPTPKTETPKAAPVVGKGVTPPGTAPKASTPKAETPKAPTPAPKAAPTVGKGVTPPGTAPAPKPAAPKPAAPPPQPAAKKGKK